MHVISPQAITGELRYDEPLAAYTSWHIGGLAKRYYRPSSVADLSLFLSSLPADEPLFWLGLGSNVLIRDGGFAGTVIHTLKMPGGIEIVHYDPAAGLLIQVPAGVPCAKVARLAAKHAVVGAEFFAGIPGTMGGALAMNAGAWGSDTWQHVVQVDVINRQGQVATRRPAEYQVGYRSVIMPQQEWFTGAQLRFLPGDQLLAEQRIKELLQLRNATQPIGLFNCGSVFRNPVGKYAAELIESSKLKGRRIGNAEVSIKHANFIINLGGASAQDVEDLICEVQATVLREHGIELVPEVKFIGERGK
jgi:UDP-N-acetylmuramate dehydrogenase